MDRASLAARIQEILRSRGAPPGVAPSASPRGPEDEEAAFAVRCSAAESASRVLDILGATLVESDHGSCVVVDREYPASYRHGRMPLDQLAGAARDSVRALPWFLGPAPGDAGPARDVSRLLFFDLETTGLSGGAGTGGVPRRVGVL